MLNSHLQNPPKSELFAPHNVLLKIPPASASESGAASDFSSAAPAKTQPQKEDRLEKEDRKGGYKREEEANWIGGGGSRWDGVGRVLYLARSGLCHHAPGLASLAAYSSSQKTPHKRHTRTVPNMQPGSGVKLSCVLLQPAGCLLRSFSLVCECLHIPLTPH